VQRRQQELQQCFAVAGCDDAWASHNRPQGVVLSIPLDPAKCRGNSAVQSIVNCGVNGLHARVAPSSQSTLLNNTSNPSDRPFQFKFCCFALVRSSRKSREADWQRRHLKTILWKESPASLGLDKKLEARRVK
jgi:hypothetical protein